MAFNRIAFNIKPCNSQNHLTFLRASSSRNLSSFSDHRAEVAPNDDLFLEYQVEAHPTADHVTVRLINTDNSDNMPPFRVMVRPQSKFSARHSGHRLTDRIVLPLVNGNMLLFKNQMTGNATERILEIFSFPPDNAALMKQLVPPVGGFMVPVRTKGLAGRIARLQRLSSSSFFDIDYGPDQRYLSIHDPTSRILTYRISWHDSTSATFDVALGLEGGAPWVYIAHHGQTFKIDEEKPNLDLSAYLELLTRQRSQFRSSASLTIFKPGFGNAAYVATVTVGPRTNLQLSSHRLDVDFVLGGGGG
ncbi:hypothetical protein D9758_011581 [Tetrapyrgos nigripes]|uniref:Uncharacterized protein n=1 Tax=Tetrapyrgos nigripes TaxID=182062 RepID=A0A8H5CQ11_9AGAR|nr:hypothetical protein D9758_011581 [Tetrapyrgos nigripes]